jgi:hypothetical protein
MRNYGMSFVNELMKAEREKLSEDFLKSVKESYQKKDKEKHEFRTLITETLNDIETIKGKMLESAKQGHNTFTILDNFISINPPFFRQTTSIEGYKCVKPAILTSRPHPEGFNRQWYEVDSSAGKGIIIDSKLVLLWEALEELGVTPYFDGGCNSASLCVRW